jgi:hypothetical protein
MITACEKEIEWQSNQGNNAHKQKNKTKSEKHENLLRRRPNGKKKKRNK